MFTNAELIMNRDNLSALVIAMTVVVSVIVGFTIYFNNPSLNQVWPVQQQKDKGLFVGGVRSPNVKSAAQTGISHQVISSGMIENLAQTTIKIVMFIICY